MFKSFSSHVETWGVCLLFNRLLLTWWQRNTWQREDCILLSALSGTCPSNWLSRWQFSVYAACVAYHVCLYGGCLWISQNLCNTISPRWSIKYPLLLQITEYAYKNNLATLHPEPSDKEGFVHSLTYTTDYDEFVVDSYRWPEDSMTVQSCKL